ncbi:NUDIX domain-containing protein [Streptomyces sp. NPDC020917]|uniref:NUDIX domain-containing protein n=1 Tax=Streptomyces sp. NPDC020917 TaxID=3365102 RepID=UPI0037B5054B
MHADTDWKNPPPRRMGCLAIIRNPRGGILLENTSYRDYWQLPGGGALANEEPHDACAREVAEELSLDAANGFRVGSLLVVDYTPPTETSVEGVNFVYDGGIIPTETKLTLPKPAAPGEKPEILATTWVDLYDLGRYTTAHQVRRILAAITVLSHPGAPRDLVRGRDRGAPTEPTETPAAA